MIMDKIALALLIIGGLNWGSVDCFSLIWWPLSAVGLMD
mgnify:CR=1 FL=1